MLKEEDLEVLWWCLDLGCDCVTVGSASEESEEEEEEEEVEEEEEGEVGGPLSLEKRSLSFRLLSLRTPG